jgi:predicted transcriptional regulator YdeE
MRKHFYLLFLIAFLGKQSYCQKNYKIITEDVLHFWEAVDSLKNNKDTVAIFQNLVINKATDAFKVFIKKWHITAKDYAYQIKEYPKFYNSLRQNSLTLIHNKDSIEKIINKFQAFYPNFIPGDICIGFGNFNTGGNADVSFAGKYIYIGLEYHGLDTNTITTELSKETRDYVSRSNFYRTIIHELVHLQQYTHGKKIIKALNKNTLAAKILREGIPDFIGKLICPNGNTGNNFDYGIKHEEQLKQKLKNELTQKDISYWLYNSTNVANHPSDLGYFMGARIAKSYFEKKLQSNYDLTSLIEIKNVQEFIMDSKYFD